MRNGNEKEDADMEGRDGNVFFVFRLFVLTKCGLKILARHTKEDSE